MRESKSAEPQIQHTAHFIEGFRSLVSREFATLFESAGTRKVAKDRVTAKSNHTTKGWDLHCATCDGTTEWFPLQYLKEGLLNMLSSARMLMNLPSNGGCITRLGSATASSLRLMFASRRNSQFWHRSACHRKASAGDEPQERQSHVRSSYCQRDEEC